jgi:hypothetical protein
LTWATHFSDWRYASDFGRRRISAVWRLMRNSSAALEDVVLPREAERLVVVRLHQQSRVVDLEHVDLREVTMQRLRVRNRVTAIERVGEEDEPALLADRGQRVLEAHAACYLLSQEEPDHLALPPRLDLLAGDDDEITAACELYGLERAAEDVVVGDRDRAEPDLLRCIEQG